MTSRRAWLALGLGVITLGVGAAWLVLVGGWPVSRPSTVRASLSVGAALAGSAEAGYARAVAVRPFSFPLDHGPHLTFRTEWWYYTGNLRAADGRHFGFQLTFFRTALVPEAVPRASEWGASQVYLAHFALTDTRGGRFHAFSRTSRGALGLAGAQAAPFRVWLDGWMAEGEGPRALPMRLWAAEEDVALDLVLDSAKPVVLQGEGGLSRKGPEPGNASYYYSLTRMPARGSIRMGAARFAVEGLAWMDREWSTSALGADLGGWDWFALQLADGRELMYYVLRRKGGGVDPFSAGTLIDAAGAVTPLGWADLTIEVLGTWTSPRSGVHYPARWRLIDRARELVLEITPRLADQELTVGPRYWEGAVEVNGSAGGRLLTGQGYVELVGYGEAW